MTADAGPGGPGRNTLAWILPAATLVAIAVYYYETKWWAYTHFLHVWPLDFGQFIQSIWNASRGRGLIESVHLDGENFLAVHFSPVLYVEALGFRILPRMEGLLALRVICMVLLPGAGILFWARRNPELGGVRTSLLLILLFLNPVFHADVLNDIRSESLILGFMVLAYVALVLDNLPLWLVSLVAILGMKENGSLVVICLSLYALTLGKRRRAFAGLVLGVLGLVAAVVVFGHFGGHRNLALYGDLLGLRFGRVFLSVGYKCVFASLVAVTLCLLPVIPWRRSRILLLLPYALVYLPMNGRLGAGFETYHAHYTTTLLGALFVMTLDSIDRLSGERRFRKRLWYAVGAVSAALVLCAGIGWTPFSRSWWEARSPFDIRERTLLYRSALADIPPECPAAVTSSLLPNLAMRERVKLFDYKPDFQEVECIVVDLRDPMPHRRGALEANFQDVLRSPEWEEVARYGDSIFVFRRRLAASRGDLAPPGALPEIELALSAAGGLY